jgi:Glycosyl-transferase for dystroglycan
LAVQSSLDHAFRLVELVRSWPGAVSCALFAPGQEWWLTLALVSYLRRCHPAIGRQVNFHLVQTARRAPGARVRVSPLHLSCRLGAEEVVRHLLRLRSNATVGWRRKMAYPQNVLRNVARSHCANQWVMCPDVDMVLPPPSTYAHLPAHLSRFLEGPRANSCEKCAFVLPVYEIDDSAK